MAKSTAPPSSSLATDRTEATAELASEKLVTLKRCSKEYGLRVKKGALKKDFNSAIIDHYGEGEDDIEVPDELKSSIESTKEAFPNTNIEALLHALNHQKEISASLPSPLSPDSSTASTTAPPPTNNSDRTEQTSTKQSRLTRRKK
jgi:hypothetical protein